MKRLLVAPPAVAAVAASLGLITGVSAPSAGAATGHRAGHHGGSTMHMSMPGATAASAARARPTVELHRKVVQVAIKNFAFSPKHLVVSPGTKVVWTNKDSDPHTVTSDDPAFHSEAINTNGHYTLVAKKKGTFPYHCQIHPFMHGMLVVQG